MAFGESFLLIIFIRTTEQDSTLKETEKQCETCEEVCKYFNCGFRSWEKIISSMIFDTITMRNKTTNYSIKIKMNTPQGFLLSFAFRLHRSQAKEKSSLKSK